MGESPGISDQSVGARAPPRCDHEEAGPGRPRCRSVMAERGRVRTRRSSVGWRCAPRRTRCGTAWPAACIRRLTLTDVAHQSTTTHPPTNACCTSPCCTSCTSNVAPVGSSALRWGCRCTTSASAGFVARGSVCVQTEGRKKKKTRKSIDRKRCSERSMLRSIRLTAGSFRAVTAVGQLASFSPHKFSDAIAFAEERCNVPSFRPVRTHRKAGFRAILIPHSLPFFF